MDSLSRQHRLLPLVALAGLLCAGGCVRRTLEVRSDPPGALVYLNGQEFGRTPVEREFTWYGKYDVRLRLDGHETVRDEPRVIAPWWQMPPIDLLAELLPLRDRKRLSYRLRPTSEVQTDRDGMLTRAQTMRGMLRSTRNTRRPTTNPAD